MVFSSILFLFKFLGIGFLIYYLTPKKFKNFVLFILSLIFYSWGEPKYFPIMIASVAVDYIAGRGISHFNNKLAKRLFLTMSVVFNLGMLFFFKYTNFFVDNINMLFNSSIPALNITLPLGISFYTFQTMSYTIDVYRGKVEAEKNIINFAAFVVLFPQLIAGPIVKYSDISRELKDRSMKLPQIEDGIRLFIMGVGSKVLIANSIGMLWDSVKALGFENISSPLAWLGVIGFAFQIYFDFSGYSLMAIGLGKMLGFNFPQNFNYPYISKSVTEFWRRWHITLGSWFREYLYIPLGGNRKGNARLLINLFVVWFATGFWHGASWNFILWGLYFGVLIVLEKFFYLPYLEKSKIWSRVYLIFIVLISWAIFAVTDMGELSALIAKMFAFDFSMDWVFYLRNYGITILMAIFFSTPATKKIYDRLGNHNIITIAFLALVLIISTAYLVDATYNPFLYFRF